MEFSTFNQWFNDVLNSKTHNILLQFENVLSEMQPDEHFKYKRNKTELIEFGLRLPDFCGHVEWPTLKPTDRQTKLFDKYMSPYMKSPNGQMVMTGKWLSQIRNRWVHEFGIFCENLNLTVKDSLYEGGTIITLDSHTIINCNLLNISMQIIQTALWFYLSFYKYFDNCYKTNEFTLFPTLYPNSASLSLVREFAKMSWEENTLLDEFPIDDVDA